MTTRRVLGIDPGLGSTGYGVIDYCAGRYRLVTYGVITTKPHEPHGERLLIIYNRLTAIISDFRPTEAGMETLFFARNVSSALTVSEAKGVVTLCLAQNAIPLGEYAPNTIKLSVTGSAGADKQAVQEYIKLLLGLPTIPEPDHAADALAAAITHINQRTVI